MNARLNRVSLNVILKLVETRRADDHDQSLATRSAEYVCLLRGGLVWVQLCYGVWVWLTEAVSDWILLVIAFKTLLNKGK